MSVRTFLYTVHTRSGIRFIVEADNLAQAESRARDPIIARTLTSMLSRALADIERVEPYRGPLHMAEHKLLFKADLFSAQAHKRRGKSPTPLLIVKPVRGWSSRGQGVQPAVPDLCSETDNQGESCVHTSP